MTAAVATAESSVAGAAEEEKKFPALRWFFGYIGYYLCYATAVLCLGTILLPQSLVDIGMENPAAALGTVAGAGTFISLVATIFAGAMGDITRTKWGKRTPWLVLGTAISAVAYAAMGFSGSLVALLVFYVGTQIGNSFMFSPVQARMAEQVPHNRMGLLTTAVSFGNGFGTSAGAIIGALLINNISMGFLVSAGLLVLGTLIWRFLIPFEASTKDAPMSSEEQAESVAVRVLKAFRPPTAAPNYWKAWITRSLFMLARQMFTGFQLYIATGYIGLPKEQAAAVIAAVSALGFIITFVTSWTGVLSDLINRRKPFAVIGALVSVIGFVALWVAPSVETMFICAVFVAIGNGIYCSIDDALNADVLPSTEKNVGAHMSFMQAATCGGQASGMALAGALVAFANGSYALIFPVAIILYLISIVSVASIKGIK